MVLTINKNIFIKKIAYAVSFLCVVYFSIAMPLGFAPDYFQYIYYFDMIEIHGLDYALNYRFEPGFALLSYGLLVIIGSSSLVYSLIVIASTLVKMHVVSTYSRGWGFVFALLLFFFKFFLLQDFNQLRVALSIGFVLLCFASFDKSYRLQFLLGSFAVLFHYSALMVLPFVYLCRYEWTRTQIFMLASALFLSLRLIVDHVLSVLSVYIPVVTSYATIGVDSAKDAVFSPVFFPEFLALAALLIFWRDCNAVIRKIFLLQTIGFSVFYGLIDLDIFAVRGREFFSIFWVLFVAQFSCSGRVIRYVQLVFLVMSMVLGLYLFGYLEYMTHELRWVE